MGAFFESKCEEVVRYRFTDPGRAYDACCEILKHGIVTEEQYEIAYAYLYMGDTLFSLGKMKEALDHMFMAEKIQTENGFEDLLVKNYNITAIIYMTQGDELCALEYYLKAIPLAKKLEDYVFLGMLYNNIGALLYNLGDAVTAAEYFESGYCISKRHKEQNPFNEKQFHLNICSKYIVQKKYDLAKEYMDQAMQIDDTTDGFGKITDINTLTIYLQIYMGLGMQDEAAQIMQEIRNLPKERNQDVEAFGDFVDIVDFFITYGAYDEAERILQIISDESEKNDILSRKFEVCKLWISLCKAKKDEEKLSHYYQSYFWLKQKINQGNNDMIVTAIDNRYKLEQERTINAKLIKDNKELSRKSEIDELTKIGNRYGLNRRFNKWCQYAALEQEKLCFGILDIDYFKRYNDTYGHLQGDACLKKIAELLSRVSDEEYYVARYGGDEFVVLGIGKTDAEIEAFLDGLFARIKEEQIPFEAHPVTGFVTISMGVVNMPVQKDLELSDFLRLSDEVLYEVKRAGKNKYMLKK